MKNYLVTFDIGMPHLRHELTLGVKATFAQDAISSARMAYGERVFHYFRVSVREVI